MSDNNINEKDLGKVSGGLGFPNGELPAGQNLCPRCGERNNLRLVDERWIENTGNPTIESTLKDKTYRLYECSYCGMKFWRYGNFWEKY